jgi:hypothetical protein
MGDMIDRAAALAAIPSGWTGAPHQSNMDFGPNVAAQARAAIAALPPAPVAVEALVKAAQRSKDGWANVLELGIILEQHRWSAKVLHDELDAALAAIRAGGGV